MDGDFGYLLLGPVISHRSPDIAVLNDLHSIFPSPIRTTLLFLLT